MINEVDKIKALVEKKQQLLKLAWLSSTKHTRPGIPQGLPVADAEIKALELDKEIRELRKK
jgi:S-methylmethionine-dependent homocysteine/selenocysteine methylase